VSKQATERAKPKKPAASKDVTAAGGEAASPHGEAADAKNAPGSPSNEIVRLIESSAVTMVKKTIDKAMSGDYRAMKYLFDLAGLIPGEMEQEKTHQNSLAMILLRHLGVPQEMIAEEEAEFAQERPAPARVENDVAPIPVE
jgi:hypothetical protein